MNLDKTVSIKMFLASAPNRESYHFSEFLFHPDNTPTQSTSGAYSNQVILTFIKTTDEKKDEKNN